MIYIDVMGCILMLRDVIGYDGILMVCRVFNENRGYVRINGIRFSNVQFNEYLAFTANFSLRFLKDLN